MDARRWLISAVTVVLLFSPTIAQITFQRTYGGSRADYGRCLVQAADGGYIIAGSTDSYGAGGRDIWLVKTDSAGMVAIEEPEPPALREPATAPTVVSRAQLLARMAQPGALLFDATGREVTNPSRVSPGIYSIRESHVRKILVTR